MENLIKVIAEAHEKIREQFIQNNQDLVWTGLEYKIVFLQEIANKLITDEELLLEIEKTKQIIVGNSEN